MHTTVISWGPASVSITLAALHPQNQGDFAPGLSELARTATIPGLPPEQVAARATRRPCRPVAPQQWLPAPESLQISTAKSQPGAGGNLTQAPWPQAGVQYSSTRVSESPPSLVPAPNPQSWQGKSRGDNRENRGNLWERVSSREGRMGNSGCKPAGRGRCQTEQEQCLFQVRLKY